MSQSRLRTARAHGTDSRNGRFGAKSKTCPAPWFVRAARFYQAHPQKELRQSMTEFWISLTDSVQLRRIQ